jgi:hypothetical protein
MKAKIILTSGLFLFCINTVLGQGTLTLVYDQQSATATTPTEGGVSDLQAAQTVWPIIHTQLIRRWLCAAFLV